MSKVVYLEPRGCQLEQQVQVAWAEMVCSILRSMAAGTNHENPISAVCEFVRLHDAALKTSKDIGVRIPVFTRDNDPDERTNLIARGSLRMVAEVVRQNATKRTDHFSPPKGPAYDAARLEVVRGIRLMLDRLSKARQ